MSTGFLVSALSSMSCQNRVCSPTGATLYTGETVTIASASATVSNAASSCSERNPVRVMSVSAEERLRMLRVSVVISMPTDSPTEAMVDRILSVSLSVVESSLSEVVTATIFMVSLMPDRLLPSRLLRPGDRRRPASPVRRRGSGHAPRGAG